MIKKNGAVLWSHHANEKKRTNRKCIQIIELNQITRSRTGFSKQTHNNLIHFNEILMRIIVCFSLAIRNFFLSFHLICNIEESSLMRFKLILCSIPRLGRMPFGNLKASQMTPIE